MLKSFSKVDGGNTRSRFHVKLATSKGDLMVLALPSHHIRNGWKS